MPEGIILAAGLSLRSGDFKLTRPLAGRSVIECAVAGMAAVCERIIVVAGFQAERLQPLLAGYPGVELTLNPGYAAGMFSSVKTGLRAVRGDAVFLLPGDIPLVPAEVYRRLAEVAADIAVPTFHGRRGHPVLIRSPMVQRILAWPEDSTLAAFIHSAGSATVAVSAEEILLDLDTAADHRQLRRRRRASENKVS